MTNRSQIRAWLGRAERGEAAAVAAEVLAAGAVDDLRTRLLRRLEGSPTEGLTELARLMGIDPPVKLPAVASESLPRIPPRVELANPGPFLDTLRRSEGAVSLDGSVVLQSWAVVGLAALGRPVPQGAWRVQSDDSDSGSRFAHALGLGEVLSGAPSSDWGESGRTVRLQRLTDFGSIEPVADRIARLIAPSDVSSRDTIHYVLVELFRNVLQHSRDAGGAVVAAQSMTSDQRYDREAIQVAVADTGIGILESLRGRHRELDSAEAAVEKALRAHISGTFEEGLTGSADNAGFGLFAISELAKLTMGRLLVATRGAALLLSANKDVPGGHQTRFVPPPHTGFPGTLVAFELPVESAATMDDLMEEVRRRAKAQTPRRLVQHWIRFESPTDATEKILVRMANESPAKAEQIARRIRSAILAAEPVLLDFEGMRFVTQSFLHALLFKPLRLAWAERFPVCVVNAAPAVRSALELLEEYALAG